jgi:hypothetical protein
VSDYFLHNMAKIRIEELQAEAARAHTAKAAKGSRGGGWRFGFFGGWWPRRAAEAGVTHDPVKEACCA